MPTVLSPREEKPLKILYLGHTGAGKTGSLCSLAAAGYNVRVLDLDNGWEIFTDFLTNKEKSPYCRPKDGLWTQDLANSVAERLSWVTITERYNIVGTKAVPRAEAWSRLNQQLNNWTDEGKSFGNISKWTSQDVLVIDGLSRLCEAAMNFQLSLNGRLDKGPRVGTSGDNDYTQAYSLITNFLDLLKSDDIKCQIIMICHIQFMVEMQQNPTASEALKDLKGFPQTVGKLISPRIGQYFNHSLRAKTIGTGPGTRRVIVTNNDENIELKNTAPLRVRAEYPLEFGLAEYFKTIRGPKAS